MQGKFIVLEGIDGSGKSWQAKLLVGYLFDKAKNNHVFLTREPYDSPYLADIRRILKESKDPALHAVELAELFVKDRKVHAEIIKRHLAEGTHVICDRYKHSTLAYQRTQGIAIEKLLAMHEGVLVPDLTLLFDVPAKIAQARLGADKTRPYHEVFEIEAFQEKIRQNFLQLPNYLLGERMVVLDGTGSPEVVFGLMKAEVDMLFIK
ncbi:MAG TPA: dTMP kinase [Patescibacteria group bacterium]|nr:dTMP kinase [Patescibacteria group bacterium]